MNTSKILNILLAAGLVILLIKSSFQNTEKKSEQKESEAPAMTTEASVLKIIHQRKSVRNYTDKKVSREQLETLVRAGMAAPTAANKQPWAFIAIDDRNTLDKLAAELPHAKMLKQAQSAIVVCGDLTKTLEGAAQAFWVQDCSAATENILLAAEAMGLGAVWTGVYPDDGRVKAVSTLLNLPKQIIPLNVIPVGYPVGVDKPKDKWKPENLHWQLWQQK
jgi:nitroreductase